MHFPILSHEQLIEKVRSFDAVKYSKSRNFLDGEVSMLSPYITHGVITIDEIVKLSLKHHSLAKAESRYKELLRREYFVQVHYRKQQDIMRDIEPDKTNIPKQELLPRQVVDKTFESQRVNQCILQLETTGYLHNHQRMRLASYMTHRQKLHRKKCADWTYYHFLDGELGSNHLSRQRVQSTFSGKPYYMNEENLNHYGKYTDPHYRGSYEDVAVRLFDPLRTSQVEGSDDVHETLKTDLSQIIPHSDLPHITSYQTVLTPRDFHPTKIQNPDTTLCFLDEEFCAQHPRSHKRIQFVTAYCALYGIPLVK